MSKFLAVMSLFCLFSNFLLETQALAKFDRVMVISGGGYEAAVSLGMLEGAQSVGKNPDLIISSCGGSIAGALIKLIPDPVERKQFVQSKEFWEALKLIKPNKNSTLAHALDKIFSMQKRHLIDRLPDIFTGYFFDVPLPSYAPLLDHDFSTDGIAVIMVAAKMYFTPKDVYARRNGRKLYKEVFFTDEKTAKLIPDFRSPIAKEFPNSSVQDFTETLVGFTLSEAMRASISDPYYMAPQFLKDQYYLTGGVDLYPIELAHAMANEVIMQYTEPFDEIIEVPAIYSTFRFQANQRLRNVTDQSADYWIDTSDEPEIDKKYGFDPDISGSKLKIFLPTTYEEYLKKVNAQWEYGRSRAVEALSRTTKNDKSHIRAMNGKNTSAKTLEMNKKSTDKSLVH